MSHSCLVAPEVVGCRKLEDSVVGRCMSWVDFVEENTES